MRYAAGYLSRRCIGITGRLPGGYLQGTAGAPKIALARKEGEVKNYFVRLFPRASTVDAGAGGFYARCGYTEVGRAVYRDAPLIYFELLLT